MLSVRNIALLFVSLVFLSGCTAVSLNARVSLMSARWSKSACGLNMVWNNGTDLDREAAEKLRIVA